MGRGRFLVSINRKDMPETSFTCDDVYTDYGWMIFVSGNKKSYFSSAYVEKCIIEDSQEEKDGGQ